ncbi:MAG: hypothetical protein Q4D57_01845 [Clostridia bacterium]|nr:hypothetical protein [Clostridia bacterium]
MNQKLKEFQLYIKDMFTYKATLSLTRLMENLCESLEKYKLVPHIFSLIEPYKNGLDEILKKYKSSKESCKSPESRKRLRKETAKKFFEILAKLGAIIPKWLSAMPEDLSSNNFHAWRERTSATEFKCITDVVKNFSQFRSLRNSLGEMADAVANTAENRRLKRLVATKISQESCSEGEFKISAPTIKRH